MLALLKYPRTLLRILKATEIGGDVVFWCAIEVQRTSAGRYGIREGRRTVRYTHEAPMVRKGRNSRTKGRVSTLAGLELLPLTLWVWVLYLSLGAEDWELECAFPF